MNNMIDKQLEWEELNDNDLIDISHLTNANSPESIVYESRKISFNDLCHAIRVKLMVSDAIPFDGED